HPPRTSIGGIPFDRFDIRAYCTAHIPHMVNAPDIRFSAFPLKKDDVSSPNSRMPVVPISIALCRLRVPNGIGEILPVADRLVIPGLERRPRDENIAPCGGPEFLAIPCGVPDLRGIARLTPT